MSELKIRTIRDRVNEPITTIVGIDRFDDIETEDVGDSGVEYYCATLVLNSDGTPIENPKPCFGKQSSFGHSVGMDIHFDDEFNLPTPQMYNQLSLALKREGIIFNKKKCRFQKVNNEQTQENSEGSI